MQKRAVEITSDYVGVYQEELDQLDFEPEREFETLIEEEDILISGAIDLVRHDNPPRVSLIDFKSGNSEEDLTALDEEEMRLQISLYGLAAKKELEYEPDEGMVRYLAEEDPDNREMTVNLSDEAIEGAKNLVIELTRDIKEREFHQGPKKKPRAAEHEIRCAECDFLSFCGQEEAVDFKNEM
jgi:DNA helicase-2/ATP-dependent DNA helicase PcrA